jgi:hypothetical protein
MSRVILVAGSPRKTKRLVSRSTPHVPTPEPYDL